MASSVVEAPSKAESARKRPSESSGSRSGSSKESLTETSAAELEALANDPRFEPRKNDLLSLSEAIRKGEHDVFSPWASVSLFSAFPPASTVVVSHRSRLESVLGVLAGITAFLPVAWTWWSLKEAAQAYSQMIHDGTAAGASFLELWSTGFDGQLAFLHQFAPMALISFGLILFSVAVIVLHRMALNRAAQDEHENAVTAEAELASTLTLAQRALVSRNVDDPAHVAALVESSLTRLSAAHKETQESAEALRIAVEETGETLRSASVESAEILVRGTASSSESMADATQAARRELEETSQSAAAAAVHTRALMQEMLDSAGQAMSQSSEAIVGTLNSFARTESALDGSASRLVHAVESLGTGGKEAMQSFQQDLRAVSGDLRSIQSDYGQSLDKSVEAVRQIQLELGRLSAGAKGQIGELTRTTEATQYAATQFSQATAAMGHLSNGHVR